MTLQERLRQAIDLLPPEAALSLPVSLVRELLDSVSCPEPVSGDDCHDLTGAELAARLARPRSTVRAWVKAGRFIGAYKLSPRDWRVPETGLSAFFESRQAALSKASTV